MARPKARFTSGQETLPVDFENDNIRQDLVDIYLEERGNRTEYLWKSVAKDEVFKLTGGRTLAEKFADDLIEAAQPLLYYKQVSGLILSSEDMRAEVAALIQITENGELLRHISPNINILLGGCIEVIKETSGLLDELYAKFREIEKDLNASKGKKSRLIGCKQGQIESFFEEVCNVFDNHGFPFVPSGPNSEQDSFAEIVVDCIFDSIEGNEFNRSIQTIRKEICEYKSKIKKTNKSFIENCLPADK